LRCRRNGHQVTAVEEREELMYIGVGTIVAILLLVLLLAFVF
jgi:hypothetical protein